MKSRKIITISAFVLIAAIAVAAVFIYRGSGDDLAALREQYPYTGMSQYDQDFLKEHFYEDGADSAGSFEVTLTPSCTSLVSGHFLSSKADFSEVSITYEWDENSPEYRATKAIADRFNRDISYYTPTRDLYVGEFQIDAVHAGSYYQPGDVVKIASTEKSFFFFPDFDANDNAVLILNGKNELMDTALAVPTRHIYYLTDDNRVLSTESCEDYDQFSGMYIDSFVDEFLSQVDLVDVELPAPVRSVSDSVPVAG